MQHCLESVKPQAPSITTPCLAPSLAARSDEVDEHGFQMQHVVQVNIGFMRDAPNTAVQAGAGTPAVCWCRKGAELAWRPYLLTCQRC